MARVLSVMLRDDIPLVGGFAVAHGIWANDFD